jgi:hypothetical protein
VAWAGTQQSYEAFISRHGVTFQNIDDTPGDVYSRFKITGQPAWAFISQDGTAEMRFHSLTESEIDEWVDQMLSSSL